MCVPGAIGLKPYQVLLEKKINGEFGELYGFFSPDLTRTAASRI